MQANPVIDPRNGASKALLRRGDKLNKILFSGNGIDIGAGQDSIARAGYSAYPWDREDGDAQFLKDVADDYYDFVHSSHCLEHMVSVKVALKNWVRVCRPGGYITIVIPDEELYERNHWPSKFNVDHKWSFRICAKKLLHKKSINVVEMVTWFCDVVEVLSITRIEEGFSFLLDKSIDQTDNPKGPECSIEIILRKM